MVGNAPRAQLRAGRRAAEYAGADRAHGRPRRQAPVPRRAVLHPGRHVHGFAMFNASAEEQRAAADEINRWLAEGKLHARVSRVMRLAETAEAHRLQEQSTLAQSGALAGKIVLEP